MIHTRISTRGHDYEHSSYGDRRMALFKRKAPLVSSRDSITSAKSSSFEENERILPRARCLKLREYLLLLIEATLSFVYYVISLRSHSQHVKLNLTLRQIIVFSLYTEGYSTLACLFIGCLADSYLTHYACALATVFFHFTVIVIVFMEATINQNQPEDPYAVPLTDVCLVALALIKASDFTRLVYALVGMTNRTKSSCYVFIFLHFWVSSYAISGGIIVNLFSVLFNYYGVGASKLPVVAVILNGLSLYLFVYALEPETHFKEHTGLGCKVVGCLILATYYKVFRIKKKGRKGFLGKTEGSYSKNTISRTKELAKLCVLLIPCFGLVFLTVMPTDLFYRPIIERIKTDKLTRLIGLKQLARSILAVTMIVSYVLIWPVLHWIGFKNSEMVRFLIGHFVLAFVIFYAALLMRDVGRLEYAESTGFVRMYNTRGSPVSFNSVDREFSSRDFDVPPNSGKILAYPASHRCQLFPVMVNFNGKASNFTMFLSVCPYETVGYMILDPPEIARIRGYIPLREGPPGANVESWARIYIFNTAMTLSGNNIQIRHLRHKVVKEITIPQGQTTIISLEPAMYEFSIFQANIKKFVLLREGGLYGLLLHATITERIMTVDEIGEPNTLSVWLYLILYFLAGIGSSFSYPSLRGLIFNGAPRGLMAMSFAFLAFFEGISLWICYIGFLTWHKFVSSNTLFVYASVSVAFFLLCFYVTLKYRAHFS